jgi:hypothetical protein
MGEYLHYRRFGNKCGSVLRESVKRVVLTSSTATVLQDEPEPKTFSESDWNEQVLWDVSEKGSAASGHTKYRAAKVLGERGACVTLYIRLVALTYSQRNSFQLPGSLLRSTRTSSDGIWSC